MKIFIIAIFTMGFTSAQGSAQCGGTEGNHYFDDQVYYFEHGDISGFRIYEGSSDCYINGIQMKYGPRWAEEHVTNKEFMNTVFFEDGERITWIEMDSREYKNRQVVCKITVFTNQDQYGPYCDYDCNQNRCQAKSGPFMYIRGRYGDYLDYLEWV